MIRAIRHDLRYPRASQGGGLVLAFGAVDRVDSDTLDALRELHPGSVIVGCTTAGDIQDARVSDGSVTVTALEFEHTEVRAASAPLLAPQDSFGVGQALGRQLRDPRLVHVLVFSDGLSCNGTALAAGFVDALGAGVAVTGALAGDGERMERTHVVADAPSQPNCAVAVGFYGERLRVGYGCEGGWDPFGPERLVTRAEGNDLFELDGLPAIALYEKFLGPHAEGLPSSGLRFPLAVRRPSDPSAVVRTLLQIDRSAGSIRFAGDLPNGHYARLMTANPDRLVNGAHRAAAQASSRLGERPQFALLVSCVGRRMVLRQRSEEELEAAAEALGAPPCAGLYSYGELCPSRIGGSELHNQTMTVTAFAEV